MKENLAYSVYYMSFAGIMLGLVLVFIPKAVIRRLFWFGMVWGSLVDVLVEHGYYFLGLTRYEHAEPFNIGVLSLWTILA
jgi:hypothetical protein